MKKNLLVAAIAFISLISSCGDNENKKNENPSSSESTQGTTADKNTSTATAQSNPKGVGKFTNVELTHPLDQKMVDGGKAIYDMKCGSCHKLSEEKLVGPGWKGVTDRRQPEWIMNFVTNTEEMLEKDTEAKNLYEVCLVKMPNQNLSDADAHGILEFMRNNDGKK
jgi:cytochrome c551/c552